MKIGSDKWKRLVQDGAKLLDIHLDSEQIDLFVTHAVELVKWNRKINLTTITDPSDIAVKHFLDSIAPAKLISPAATVLDVGSGGGFPGIPLKIVLPSLRVTLIDASRKKINFLKHVIRTLNLKGMQALHVRAEDLATRRSKTSFGKESLFENAFDVIICRALTSLDNFALMVFPLLVKGGCIIALKGKVPESEIETVRMLPAGTPEMEGIEKRSFSVDVHQYTLPHLESERSIVVIK